MINEDIFGGSYLTEEMKMFRKSLRQFIEKECVSHRKEWQEQEMVDRNL